MSRLVAASFGGVFLGSVGLQMYSQQCEAKLAALAQDVTRLPAYKRFVSFASVVEESKQGVVSSEAATTATATAAAATTTTPQSQRVMSIQDFVLSLTTGPSVKPLSAEAAAAIFNDGQVQAYLKQLIPLVDRDRSGTVDFTEFLTLHTLLAIPTHQLRSTLELFDRPGKSRVTLPQFNAVLRAMSAGRLGTQPQAITATATAAASNGNSNSAGTTAGDESSLETYFFGPDGKGSVTVDDFVARLADIRQLVRAIEFRCALLADAQEKSAAAGEMMAAQDKASLNVIRSRLFTAPPSSPDKKEEKGEAKKSETTNAADGEAQEVDKKKASSFVLIDEDSPVVGYADFAVMMALLGNSSDWTPGLKLYLQKDDNELKHDMLCRVLTHVDISARIPAGSALAKEAEARIGARSSVGETGMGAAVEQKQQQQQQQSSSSSSLFGWWGSSSNNSSAAAPAPVPEAKYSIVSKNETPVYPSARHAVMFSQLMDQTGDGNIDVDEIERVAAAYESFYAPFEAHIASGKRNVVQQWVFCMQQKDQS